jgi:hypothetical protein
LWPKAPTTPLFTEFCVDLILVTDDVAHRDVAGDEGKLWSIVAGCGDEDSWPCLCGIFQKGGCIGYKILPQQDVRCYTMCCYLNMAEINKLQLLWGFKFHCTELKIVKVRQDHEYKHEKLEI